MTNTGQTNLRWSQYTAEVLYRLGVRFACISPGSRNTPLTSAFTAHAELTSFSLIDERSAGYFALGLAKSSATPVVLISTSGTATANYYPAVIEANLGRTPLILLTADRPSALVGTGANQTVNQKDLYGAQVRLFRDVGLPKTELSNLIQHLNTAMLMALGLSADSQRQNPPGPVHLNFPFDEPLLPEAYAGNEPQPPLIIDPLWVINEVKNSRPQVTPKSLPPHRRPLIVAGGLQAGSETDSILNLGAALKAPIFADPASQLRYNTLNEYIITAYDLFLPAVHIDPDLVIRFGRKPTSKYLCRLLDQWQSRTLLIDPCGRFNDDCPTVIPMEHRDFCETQLNRIDTDYSDEWLEELRNYDLVAQDVSDHLLQEHPIGESAVIRTCLEALPTDSNLVIGNSMPIRDADCFTLNSSGRLNMFANRGASGIDGVVSTALGVAAHSHHSKNLLIIGDLSFYYDLNSLLLANRYNISLTVVLINNNGGGIFSFLPVQNLRLPAFEEFWTTPHTLDFSVAARLYGCLHKPVADTGTLRKLIGETFTLPGIKILEFGSNTQENLELHRAVREGVHNALEPRL